MLTQERLKQLLSYDESTGVFTWMVTRGGSAKAGSVAGWLSKSGYICITVECRAFYAHRLAWLYVHGENPPHHIDHINRHTDDNRIVNLRPATPSENQKNRLAGTNNTCGHKGVVWHRQSSKWRARAWINRKQYSLGLFHTPEAASAAYQEFARKHHGEFYLPTGNV